MIDETAARYQAALLETIEPYPEDSALLLSGGMDSATILAGLLTLGRKPQAYCYSLEGYESEDLAMADRMAATFGLSLRVITIPADLDRLLEDVREVIAITRNPRKTAVQCCHALLHLSRAYLSDHDGHPPPLITGAGGIVSDNRKAKILGANYALNGEALEAQRRTDLLGGDRNSATEEMKRFAVAMRIDLREPYSQNPLAETGLSIPFPEMNRPVPKGIACRAFPDFFRIPRNGMPGRFWRPNASLQVAGGLREHHDKLLETDQRKEARRVVAIYNRILREQQDGEQLGLI